MKTTRRMRAASLLAVAALGLSACGAVDDLTGGSDKETTNQDDGDQNQNGDDNSDEDSDDDSDNGDDNGDDNSDDDPDNGDGDDSTDDDNGGDDSTDDSNTDDDSTDVSEESDSGDQGSESLTAPGTELKVGDTATIPQGKEGGTVTVTVSKITKGTFSDLAHLKDADEYKDYTPVYVEYTIKGTANSNSLEYKMLDGFRPVLTDGRRAGSLVIIGSQKFDKCDPNSFPKGFGEGDTVTDCDIAMLADGQELGGAEFAPYEGDYADDGKVVWKQ